MGKPLKDSFKAGAPISMVSAGWFNRVARILNGLLIRGGQILRDPEDRAWTFLFDQMVEIPVKCTAEDVKDGVEEQGYHTFKVCDIDGTIASDAQEYTNCRIWGDWDKDIDVIASPTANATFGFLFTLNAENVVQLSGNICTVVD